MIWGGESCCVTGVSDQEGGHNGSDPVDVSHRGSRGGHCPPDQCLVGFDVPIEAADVGEVGSGTGTTLFPHIVQGAHVTNQLAGPVC